MGLTHQQPLAKETKEINNMFHSTNKAVILFLIVVISGTRSSGVKKENTAQSKGGNDPITSFDKQRGKFFETRVWQIVQEKFDTIDLQMRQIDHELIEQRDELTLVFRRLLDSLCDEARLKLSICKYT